MTFEPKEEEGGMWFINHPDFKEVSQTTYKKGTITDFEIVSTDPFRVKSMVKVEGDWGESDYIPLLYRPKEGYWDADGKEATEFNEEGKYYENAWKSFRCDDEVVVMLIENEPAAVVGFFDGVPRIGEEKLYWGWTTDKTDNDQVQFFTFNPQTFTPYDEDNEEPTGPDDLKLNLVQEPVHIWYGGVEETNYYYITDPWGDPESGGDNCIYANFIHCNKIQDWDSKTEYREYFVVVGPILYIIGVTYGSTVFDNWAECWTVDDLLEEPWRTQCEEEMNDDGESWLCQMYGGIQACLYSKEQLDRLKATDGRTTDDIIHFNGEMDYPDCYTQSAKFESGQLVYGDGESDEGPGFDSGNIKFRPHTKDELLDAGLWGKPE